MAELTAEQKQKVGEWAEAGATLNEIQSRLKSEFGLSMTYMEARLLMMELEVRLKDKAKAHAQTEVLQAGNAISPDEHDVEEPSKDAPVDFSEVDDVDPTGPGPTGAAFSMEADEIMVPGTLVSGSATFSDGMKARWFLDQMGRLSLKADKPGYQPPTADVPKFQQGLEKILLKLGIY